MEILRDYCTTCRTKCIPLLRSSISKPTSKPFRIVYMQCRACNNARAKKYRSTVYGASRMRDAVYRSISKYPERQKSRVELNAALRKGDVIKTPCIDCGNERVEAHHEDYSRPLEVRWLCRSCHKKADKSRVTL